MLQTLTRHALEFNKVFSEQVLVGYLCPSAESRSKTLAAVTWIDIDKAKKLDEVPKEFRKSYRSKKIRNKERKSEGMDRKEKERKKEKRGDSMVETLESMYVAAKFKQDYGVIEPDGKRATISLMVTYRGDYFELIARPLAIHYECLLAKMIDSSSQIVRKSALRRSRALLHCLYNKQALQYMVEISQIKLPEGYLPFRKYVLVHRAEQQLPEAIDFEREGERDMVKIEAEPMSIQIDADQNAAKSPVVKIEDRTFTTAALFFKRVIPRPFDFDIRFERQLSTKSIAHYSLYWLNTLRFLPKDFIQACIGTANQEHMRMYAQINNSHFDFDDEESRIFLANFGLLEGGRCVDLMRVMGGEYAIVGHVAIREETIEKMVLKIWCGERRFYLPGDIVTDLGQEEVLYNYRHKQAKREIYPGVFVAAPKP